MNMSPKLSRMVATLSRMYTDDVIGAVLADAEVKASERGGRQITVADWDAVMDDQPIEGGYRIVSSAWVPSLVMLITPKGEKGGAA